MAVNYLLITSRVKSIFVMSCEFFIFILVNHEASWLVTSLSIGNFPSMEMTLTCQFPEVEINFLTKNSAGSLMMYIKRET